MRSSIPARRPSTTAESTMAFLELSRLLNDVERSHPEISGPLRLTLVRAHRDNQIGWLDERRFREVVADLLDHTTPTPRVAAAG